MESLKSEVRQLIQKLSDRFDHLPEGALHPLDADMILSLLRQLYEKTEQLRNGSFPGADPARPELQATAAATLDHEPLPLPLEEHDGKSPEHVPAEKEQMQQPPLAGFNPEPPDSSPSSRTASPEPQLPAGGFIPESEFVRDPGPVSGKPASVPVDLFGTPTIADKLKSDTPSLNDRITSGKSDLSLADRIQLKPINDLKTAIGLNDKFQFINDLFEGSTERYTEALNLLNSCFGGTEAEKLLSDLKTRYNWDEQSPVWKKLQDFVTRRYL